MLCNWCHYLILNFTDCNITSSNTFNWSLFTDIPHLDIPHIFSTPPIIPFNMGDGDVKNMVMSMKKKSNWVQPCLARVQVNPSPLSISSAVTCSTLKCDTLWGGGSSEIPTTQLVVIELSLGVNTLRLRPYGRHFADDIFKCIFLKENICISSKISLKIFPKVQLTIFQHWFR